MSATCASNCEGEIPVEKPTLAGNRHVRASLASWVFVGTGLLAQLFDGPVLLQIGAFAVAIVAGGFYFGREAAERLFKERDVGIELLMTVAIVAAACMGNWREGAMVAALFSITEALEGFTIARSRHSIRQLMDRVPPRARVLRDGGEVELPVGEVRPKDRIQIRPGEGFPLDGTILEGSSAIDESAVTGESMPVERAPGGAVFAGTVNGNGALVVEVTRPFEDTVVSRIIQLVEKAQQQKGKSQLMIERFGRIYTPLVLGAATLLAVVPWLLGLDAAAWGRRAVSFLVAASPCALAVATPVTLVAAIGSAAKRGVLIKGGAVLEALSRVRAFAFDKTGTLTHGKPVVVSVQPVGMDEAQLLSLALAVEHFSEHPLARAIVRCAVERGIPRVEATGFRALTAVGAEADVGGKRVAVVKPSALEPQFGVRLTPEQVASLQSAQDKGHSLAAVVVEARFAGVIALADTLRPESRSVVEGLRGAGMQHLVMLTGDNAGTARAIAEEAGIEERYGGLLPEDKVTRVAELDRKYGGVAMVGDGINDAPALATATVGIAMGTGGSDAALAAADVALVGNDLGKLPYIVQLGRQTHRVVLQNITLSILIVVVLVIGTLGFDLSMLGAVIGHEGSEVVIILNRLRVALTSHRA